MPIEANDWCSDSSFLLDLRSPLFVGVRHHSAAVARAIPQLFDDFKPDSILLELPADLNDWIPFLADPETRTPVALSVADSNGGLFFYPMADFSPELAAIRWGSKHNVPVVACDLAASARRDVTHHSLDQSDSIQEINATENYENERPPKRALDELMRRAGASDTGQLWERLVETKGLGGRPDEVRRAALLFGWAMRHCEAKSDPDNEHREAAMRTTIREAESHAAIVVGAFHVPALLPDVIKRSEEHDRNLLESIDQRSDAAVSLVPYSFAQLDERSGYPAGIRDPEWHQAVFDSDVLADIDSACVRFITEICRRIREYGHTAGTPDAKEIVRVTRDLARLRKLPAAGRGEFIESIQHCLMQGESFGRGRSVARATEATLIGRRRGVVSQSVPQCGLLNFVEELLSNLNLPGPESGQEKPREIRLDVMRDPRDRARAVVLRQLSAANIRYAKRTDTIKTGKRQNLIEKWEICWHYATSAMVASAGRFGVTLTQAIQAMARHKTTTVTHHDANRPQDLIDHLRTAAECGIHSWVDDCLRALDHDFMQQSNLAQTIAAAICIGRIEGGHFVGLPADEQLAFPPIVRTYRTPSSNVSQATLINTCMEKLVGLEGSQCMEDVSAIVDLVYWLHSELHNEDEHGSDWQLERSILETSIECMIRWCRRASRIGSHRMQGVAIAILGVLGEYNSSEFASLVSSWIDRALDREGRRCLRDRLAGANQVLLPLLYDDADWLDGLEQRIRCINDEAFLTRLPSIRGGFSELSPADRRRILLIRLGQYEDRASSMSGFVGKTAIDPSELAAWRAADLAGQRAVGSSHPELFSTSMNESSLGNSLSHTSDEHLNESELVVGVGAELAPGSIELPDRWRLILGINETQSPRARRIANSLDELYGSGQGEGAEQQLSQGPSNRGGTEAPEPALLEWKGELEHLFGSDVCQEVIGEAAGQGQIRAAMQIDPDRVQPSIELLQQVLSLAGEMPEGKVGRLRQVARRITDQLSKELAIRLRPALMGLSTPRPTRRRSQRLSLKHTIRQNLAHVYRRQNGRPSVVAEQLIFHSPARRELDWHMTFVVDVSGSMTTSAVYSALVAAIFAGLPAVSVRFLAFSTEVIDLTDHVQDPLALLLQVQIGGGTHIALGLNAARSGLKQPSRSLVICVSDFEEGVSIGELLGEVRALKDSGARCLGLAALDDSGTARFHQGYAQMVASAGMPVAAVSPENLARWIGEQLRGHSTGRNTEATRPDGLLME